MSNDLIYRQAAIDAHCELCSDRGKCPDICPDVEVFRLIAPAQSELAQDLHSTCADAVSRRAAIDVLMAILDRPNHAEFLYTDEICKALEQMPSAQTESCEYCALCRHGRYENKLRVRLGFCEYCNEDADGFVTPLEKNGHAFVRFGVSGWELSLKANGWHGSAKIRYCPMCGRDLLVK